MAAMLVRYVDYRHGEQADDHESEGYGVGTFCNCLEGDGFGDGATYGDGCDDGGGEGCGSGCNGSSVSGDGYEGSENFPWKEYDY